MFHLFVVFLLFFSTLLWWPTRRPKSATHLAFRVHEEGDFRSAPRSRWETVPITGPGALSSFHEGLGGSALSLKTTVAGLAVTGAKALVFQSLAGELLAGRERRLESGLLVLDGEQVYAFIDEKMARMLEGGDWDVRMPEALDVSIARDRDALIESTRRRASLLGTVGSVFATLMLWSTSVLGTMGLSIFYPMLSQRGPFSAASLSIVLFAIIVFRASQRASATSLLRRL